MNTAVLAIVFSIAFHIQMYCAEDVVPNTAQEYTKSDMVLAGRVVGVERILETDEVAKKRDESYFGYYARFRACRIFKGTCKEGQEVLIPIGGYWARTDAGDLSLNQPLRIGGMHRIELSVGGVYLLSVIKSPAAPGVDGTWTPLNQQQSILPLSQDESGIVVPMEGQRSISLDEYISHMKKGDLAK